MGGSMGSQPQKTQGLQKFFFIIGFVELLSLIILVKKFFSIGRFFLILLPKYCQNHVKIICKFVAWFFSILALASPIIEIF
jgi:hypothetical protein